MPPDHKSQECYQEGSGCKVGDSYYCKIEVKSVFCRVEKGFTNTATCINEYASTLYIKHINSGLKTTSLCVLFGAISGLIESLLEPNSV